MANKGGQLPVVIVGAGPVGLAIAIELGTRSVPCIVLEKDAERGPSPRAKTTHTRTRELMRRWGIADELAKESPFGIDYPTHIHFVTRLNGHSLLRFDNALYCSPERDERYSEHGQWIPQYAVERVLRRKAESLPGVSFRYGLAYVGHDQSDASVSVRAREAATGAELTIEAAYLVGADGASSAVREAMGVRMLGTPGLSRNYNIIFRAPGLAEAHPHGPGVMYWMINATAPGNIGPMDKDDLWYFGPTHVPPGVTFTPDEAADLIRRSTGIDLPYEIINSDVWTAHRLLADGYRRGRAFLIGDACHLHPPFGGYGMNMGVADAVDLGWKLAATVQNWGGQALLDSYEAERRPVHELVIEESEANHAILANQLFRDGIEEDSDEGQAIRTEVADLIRKAKRQEFYSLGVVLGLRYRNSPVIPADGTEADWALSRDYVPSAAPGCIAPHAWLDDGRSLYDLFGEGFTLLVLDGGRDADIIAAQAEAERAGVPLTVVTPHEPRLASLYAAPLALVRPDQIVAWRGDAWPVEDLLHRVSGKPEMVTA